MVDGDGSQNVANKSDDGLSLRQIVHLMYALFALGVLSGGFLGIAVIAAMVLAYLKRPDAIGTVYASHIDWIIRSFWWGLLWLILSAVATLVFIGWLAGLATLIWIIYRITKGWLAHFAGQAPLAGL